MSTADKIMLLLYGYTYDGRYKMAGCILIFLRFSLFWARNTSSAIPLPPMDPLPGMGRKFVTFLEWKDERYFFNFKIIWELKLLLMYKSGVYLQNCFKIIYVILGGDEILPLYLLPTFSSFFSFLRLAFTWTYRDFFWEGSTAPNVTNISRSVSK